MATVSARVAINAEAAAHTAYTIAGAVLGTRRVHYHLLAGVTFKAGVTEALAAVAHAMVATVVLATGLDFTMLAFEAGVTVAVTVDTAAIGSTSLLTTSLDLRAVFTGVAWVTETLASGLVACTFSTAFTFSLAEAGASGSLVTIGTRETRMALALFINAIAISRASVGAHSPTILARIASVTLADTLLTRTTPIALVGTSDVVAGRAAPSSVTLTHALTWVVVIGSALAMGGTGAVVRATNTQ